MPRRSGRTSKAPDILDLGLPISSFTSRTYGVKKRPQRRELTLKNALLPNSPILEADIQSLFASVVRDWSGLLEGEKTRLIDALPPTYRVYDVDGGGHLNCPVSEGFVINDNKIKRHAARFKRDVENGFYLKKWQEEGKKAMKDRARGQFDAYRVQKTEDNFGINEVIRQDHEADAAGPVTDATDPGSFDG